MSLSFDAIKPSSSGGRGLGEGAAPRRKYSPHPGTKPAPRTASSGGRLVSDQPRCPLQTRQRQDALRELVLRAAAVADVPASRTDRCEANGTQDAAEGRLAEEDDVAGLGGFSPVRTADAGAEAAGVWR